MGRPHSSSPRAVVLVSAIALSACALSGDHRAARSTGLWMGSLQLCEATVESALIVDEPYSGRALLLNLRPGAQGQLARLTARNVGRAVPIRLDGKTLSEPIVREALLGGRIQVTGVDPELAAAAARAPC